MKGLFKKLSILGASLAMVLGAGLVNDGAKSAKADGESTYVKVTEAPTDWTGEYVLVYENSATEAYVWTGVDAVNGYESTTITDSKITLTPTAKLNIAATTNGYSIQIDGGTNNGKYVGQLKNANGMQIKETTLNNTISITDGTATIISGSAYMRFNNNSDQKRFRYYKSSSYTRQQAVQLYKLEEVETTDPSVKIDQKAQTIAVDDSVKFTATVSNADSATVKWSTDTADYGEINQDGVFTATAIGEVTVTATITVDGVDYSASVKVTIKAKATISEASISDLLEKTAADYTVVEVKGKVADLTNTEYGNFSLVDLNDSSKSIPVHGSTKDTTQLTLTNSGEGYYTGTWTSGKNFNNACAEGDIVTMHVIVTIYKKAPQISGVITNVETPEYVVFTSSVDAIPEITVDNYDSDEVKKAIDDATTYYELLDDASKELEDVKIAKAKLDTINETVAAYTFVGDWKALREMGDGSICEFLSGENYDLLKEQLDKYDQMSEAQKAIIDAQEDGGTTIGNTITYVKSYLSIKGETTSETETSQESLLALNSSNSILFVLVTGLLGLAALVGYYFANKKRMLGK